MTSAEIIQGLRQKDERITRCFFFWDGPTLQRIEALRRTDPVAAAKLRRPVCNTCRPALLSVLHKLYGDKPFDYEERVSSFYYYLIKDDKLASIIEPEALMGWIVRSAYYFFLGEKKSADKMLENDPTDSLNNVGDNVVDDESRTQSRELVSDIIAAMPNRVYARILEEVVLEVGQYKGKEKIELLKRKSEELGIPIDNLYVKISLAKKQFKQTAMKLKMI